MSYATIETGLLTLIRLLSGYSATNTAAGNYNVLSASSASSVILQPGEFSREVVAAPRRVRTAWTINIELYVPYRTDIVTIAAAIRTKRQELIDHIDKYPTLNGVAGVLHAFVVGASEPVAWEGRRGARTSGYWMQMLTMQVEERVTVTIAE